MKTGKGKRDHLVVSELEELCRAVQGVGGDNAFGRDSVPGVVARLDANHNGRIEYEEFLKAERIYPSIFFPISRVQVESLCVRVLSFSW